MSKHTTIDQLKMLAQRTKTELAALDGKIADYGLTKQETAEDGYLASLIFYLSRCKRCFLKKLY